MTTRDFFTKRKLDQQKGAMSYLNDIRELIKKNERQLVSLHSKNIKEFGELAMNGGSISVAAEERKKVFFNKLYSKADIVRTI